jgi:hypothetical protein
MVASLQLNLPQRLFVMIILYSWNPCIAFTHFEFDYYGYTSKTMRSMRFGTKLSSRISLTLTSFFTVCILQMNMDLICRSRLLVLTVSSLTSRIPTSFSAHLPILTVDDTSSPRRYPRSTSNPVTVQLLILISSTRPFVCSLRRLIPARKKARSSSFSLSAVSSRSRTACMAVIILSGFASTVSKRASMNTGDSALTACRIRSSFSLMSDRYAACCDC